MEHTGRLMVILGAFFIVVAVLLMSRIYQWRFSLCFSLGVALISAGSALHFETFKWKVPSLQGFGTISIYIAPFFIALAVVATVFAVPEEAALTPIYGGHDEHGSPFVYVAPGGSQSGAGFMVILLKRPYLWLVAPLMLTGLGLLAFGFLSKLYSEVL